MELMLIILPALIGALILAIRKYPRALLLTAAIFHSAGLATLAFTELCKKTLCPAWIATDQISLIVCGVTSFLFLCAAIHGFFWLPMAERFESSHGVQMNRSLFCGILCFFLSTMTLVAFARNFGLLWIAVEATTLASAPLICFHRSRGSLEAMWKYLLICSAGIGLALFGTFLLAAAARSACVETTLSFSILAGCSGEFHPQWFAAAFVFCLAGYGLKMGLAPFHTWLPDAHSEAPSMVSVLLSGSLLNCSFLGITRVLSVAPAGQLAFCRNLLVALGILSLLTAAFFLVRQRDYKRMLAYSSVEHIGLIAVLWGLGQENIALLHLGMHSLCKMTLFLIAGNILLAKGTRRIADVQGMYRTMPRTAALWMLGIMMICGMPPSPLFITELELVRSAGPLLGSVIMVLLFTVFCGMTYSAMNMVMGKTENNTAVEAELAAERLSILPMILLILPVATGTGLIFMLNKVAL